MYRIHVHSHKSAYAAFFLKTIEQYCSYDAFPVNYSERVVSIKRCRLQLISDKTRPVALSQSRHIERLVLPRRDDLDKHLLIHTCHVNAWTTQEETFLHQTESRQKTDQNQCRQHWLPLQAMLG
jgi:hypothetical protein